jgi:hypothetical protein
MITAGTAILGRNDSNSFFLMEYKDLLFRSARLTLPLSGESTLPITKKDNPGRASKSRTQRWQRRRPSGRIIVAVGRKIARKMQDLSLSCNHPTSKIFRPLHGGHQATCSKTWDGGGWIRSTFWFII